jgi:hypothetical protein
MKQRRVWGAGMITAVRWVSVGAQKVMVAARSVRVAARSVSVAAGWVIVAAGSAGPSWAADPPAGTVAASAAFDLVTEGEAAAWNTTQPKELKDFSTRDLGEDNTAPTCHSTPNNDADNPQIRILAPTLGKVLTAPLDINLQFIPTGSAAIRPDTFRVCYMGLITMDITKRITDRVTVSEKGLHVTGAQLPRGHHRLVLLVADQRGRLGRREAVFDID